MSIIQSIRDKYARVAVIAIALALVGFILTDYFSGRSRGGFGGGGSKTVGRVNGRKIGYDDFNKRVEITEQNMRAQGYPQTAALSSQALQQTWENEVNRLLLEDEFDKLGLEVGKRELGDILYGPNAPADLKRQFTDEAGNFNAAEAKKQIDQMLKKGTAEQKAQFNLYLTQLEDQRKTEKFVSLLANTVNYPRWMVEKQNADNSLLSKISFVREAYSSIPDSTVKVEDKEIAEYINKHKADFKQQESRSISYVAFSALPTSADSAAVKKSLTDLKPAFDSTRDAASFLNTNSSAIPLYNGFVSKSKMQIGDAKDSVAGLGTNKVYGPYLDAGNYVMAKMLEIKTLPDSVKCRHILLGTADRQGNPIMDDSVAHKKADSIAAAIRGGASFDTLNVRYSTDEAAKQDKGVMTFSSFDIQGEGFAKEFGQFILFDGKPGDKKVVKTQFGWHYIEILSFIKPEPHYKVAYMAREILASQATDDAAQAKANAFAADSRDLKTFDETFAKQLEPQGYLKNIASNILPYASDIPGLGASRTFVRNVYAADKGEVLKPELIDRSYVVAVVTEIFKEGTQSPATARGSVEPLLRNKKKAQLLKQKIGNITTVEAAATVLGKTVEVADSLRMSTGSSQVLGYEPKVLGASFNPANKGKVVPEALEGINGVYVVRVDNVSTTPVTDGNVEEKRKGLYQQAKQFIGNPQAPSYPVNTLRNAATIKDNRGDLF